MSNDDCAFVTFRGTASEPELRYIQSGAALVNMRIFVREEGRDKDSVFFIVAWDALAERIAKTVAKGQRVELLCSIRNRKKVDRATGNETWEKEFVAFDAKTEDDQREPRNERQAPKAAPQRPRPGPRAPEPPAYDDDPNADIPF